MSGVNTTSRLVALQDLGRRGFGTEKVDRDMGKVPFVLPFRVQVTLATSYKLRRTVRSTYSTVQ